jgi:hypothetical protein
VKRPLFVSIEGGELRPRPCIPALAQISPACRERGVKSKKAKKQKTLKMLKEVV